MDGAAAAAAKQGSSSEDELSGDGVDPDLRASAAPAARREHGYVDSLVSASLQLLRKDLPHQVRSHGLKLMQHLLRYRWVELHITEWAAFEDAADLIDGFPGTSGPLPSKSATAALVAEVIWSGGISLLSDLLPSITCLSERGPIEAQFIAFILKWISDFKIHCAVDFEGDECEAVLPNILLLLSTLLKKHTEAILAEQSYRLMISTEKHVLTVTAGLIAVNSYAEWIPLVDLSKYGLIERCEQLLHLSYCRFHALQFFKVACQRRRPFNAGKEYDAMMSQVFLVLMDISQYCLTKSKSCSNFVDDSQFNFTEGICECLVALGSFNMQSIIADGIKISHFLQQMMEYYQHYKIALHFRCLPFWLMVLRGSSRERIVHPDAEDVVSTCDASSRDASSRDRGNTGALIFLSDDMCSAILDVSFKRMLKTSEITPPDSLELWSDEHHGKDGFIQYRSRLLDLIRFITYQRPIIAAGRAAQRVNSVIGVASAVLKYPKDLAEIESSKLALETVVNAIFDESIWDPEVIQDTKIPLRRICKIFEGLLLQLLSLKWTEPMLVVMLGHYLAVLCPYLRRCPNVVAMVVNKLFSAMTVEYHDPSKTQDARLQICSCIIRICQAVEQTSLPSDVKDLFSVPHFTEEDMLAFVMLNRHTYSVEENQGRGGNQHEDVIHLSASNTVSSLLIRNQTFRRQPWALRGEKTGLSIALNYLQGPPHAQPSPDYCSDPAFPKPSMFNGLFGWFRKSSANKHQSYVNDYMLNPKHLDRNLLVDPQLYALSFPLHGSVPISLLGLGRKFQNRNEGEGLSLILESETISEICSRHSLACMNSTGIVHSCRSSAQRQQVHANGEFRTSVREVVDDIEKLGVQRSPMDKFDGGGQGNNDQDHNTVLGNVTSDLRGSVQSFEKNKLGIDEEPSFQQGRSMLLLREYNLLSEAFITGISFSGIQNKKQLLIYILNPLNNIWTQNDWKEKYVYYGDGLSDLFTNDQLVGSVFSLLKSFEEELTGNYYEESTRTQDSCPSMPTTNHLYTLTFPQLMLSLSLQVLHCIHMLWMQPTYNLPNVIIRAKAMISEEISSFLVETNQWPDIDEAEIFRVKKIGTSLREIRETGYKVVGLCATIEEAYIGLLDNSLMIDVLVQKLVCLEFNHLGILIQLVFIPLVNYCPHECWDKLAVNFLQPLFSHCEEIVSYAWFSLIHYGRAKVPAYFGNLPGPEEEVKKLEMELLLNFTRFLSDLLGVLASQELNTSLSHLDIQPIHKEKTAFEDLESLSSRSLVGYLILRNCFGGLSMSLFGYLVDYQAAKKALPFCYALIRVAVATNDARLNHFILVEMLPAVIQLLARDIQSSISQLCLMVNSSHKMDYMKDIACLCQEIYEVLIHNQVMVGEEVDGQNITSGFNGWLMKELEHLRICASCAAPEDFPKYFVWNWEFNEEFKRYISDYMNMLHEVDAMDDCLEHNYWRNESLLEKLRPEFKSRYAITSWSHPFLQTMSCMLQRKMPTVYYQKRSERIYEFLIQLITLKPYIKRTDRRDDVLDRLRETCETQFDTLIQSDAARAIDIFRNSILFYWEPQFHPLIREGHEELLTAIARQLTLAEQSKLVEPLEPDPNDFMEHLQPYAWTYVKRMRRESGYFTAKEQVRLHEKFDEHLASGILDHCILEFSSSKDDFIQRVICSDNGTNEFASLNRDLIQMSLERRAKIVEWEHQICSYSECLRALLENDKMKGELESLISVLDEQGFFRINDVTIDWDNEQFSDVIKEFNDLTGHYLDKCYIIRGIMDLRQVFLMKDVNWDDAYRMVVDYAKDMWKEDLEQFWMDTRYYEHDYYGMLQRPLEKVYGEKP